MKLYEAFTDELAKLGLSSGGQTEMTMGARGVMNPGNTMTDPVDPSISRGKTKADPARKPKRSERPGKDNDRPSTPEEMQEQKDLSKRIAKVESEVYGR